MSDHVTRASSRQVLTSAAADGALITTSSLVVALLVRLGTGQDSYVPGAVWAVVALLVHVANGIWLAGRTGQSVGDRVGQVAYLSPVSGRPVGVATMAEVCTRGGVGRDPRVARVSVADDEPPPTR